MDLSTPLEHRSSIPHALLHPSHPLPTLFLAHPSSSRLISTFEDRLTTTGQISNTDGQKVLEDVHDDFIISQMDSNDVVKIMEERRSSSNWTDSSRRRHEILIPSEPIDPRSSPLFDLATYWKVLDDERKRNGRSGRKGEEPRVGELLFYSEAVGSTQTMLDQNTTILHSLPTPFLSLASFQLSGRGRGSNSWISPPGCLQFSLALSLPTSFPSDKIVFVQYLFALAVCQGLDDDERIGVKIKWPNDVYAEVEDADGNGGEKLKIKIGGILVTTSFLKGEWKVIVGCGINILNSEPTTSLSKLHQLATEKYQRTKKDVTGLGEVPTMEGSLARILVAFEPLWEEFLEKKGFEPFLDEYLGRWMHTNQKVTLTTTTPHEHLMIKSITLDHGLLRCVKVDSGRSTGGDYGGEDRTSSWMRPGEVRSTEYVDLQPDGNSFDLMSGMIKKKT